MYYWGGAIALWGCDKVSQTDLNPKAEPSNQAVVASNALKPSPLTQAAWQRFVARVENGEQIDPSGQYVAKGTDVPVDANGHRIARPKFDANSIAFAQHYTLLSSGEITGIAVKSNREDVGMTPNYIEPIDPCYGCGGGPTPPPPVYTTFVSSEGKSPFNGANNPNGYIYDLKILEGKSKYQTPLPGYTLLDADLNKGAGGAYIYLTFARNPNNVQIGDEKDYKWNDNEVRGPVRAIQAFEEVNGISLRWIGTKPIRGFLPIWTPNPIPGSTWKQPDLNNGAGGAYIYAYQFKGPTFHDRPIEVGIVSSNSSKPQVPAGWTIMADQDLNKGAGGDYIYFCYKDR